MIETWMEKNNTNMKNEYFYTNDNRLNDFLNRQISLDTIIENEMFDFNKELYNKQLARNIVLFTYEKEENDLTLRIC